MTREPQVTYTEEAKKKLKEIEKEYLQTIEGLIREDKYYPGADYIEATASDIENAARSFRVESRRKTDRIRIILLAYLFVGLTSLMVGLLWDRFRDIIRSDSWQSALILAGVLTVFITAIGLLYLNWSFRSRYQMEIERLSREREQLQRYLLESLPVKAKVK